jgi:protein-S-isoprenylcysteine O-methyltransferase Ste14
MEQEQETFKTTLVHVIVGNTVAVLLMACALFFSAGRLNMWQCWAYLAIYALIPLLIYRFVPKELMKERRHPSAEVKTSEHVFMLSYMLLAFLIPALSALDAGRFAWTGPLPLYVNILSFAVILGSFGLVVWSMRVNRFFSSVIRIQNDRGHQVVQNGPYAAIRHPGYFGVILTGLAAPLALGSLAGLAPAFLQVVLTFIRAGMEDSILKRDLPGYRDYAKKVLFRLIWGIW